MHVWAHGEAFNDPGSVWMQIDLKAQRFLMDPGLRPGGGDKACLSKLQVWKGFVLPDRMPSGSVVHRLMSMKARNSCALCTEVLVCKVLTQDAILRKMLQKLNWLIVLAKVASGTAPKWCTQDCLRCCDKKWRKFNKFDKGALNSQLNANLVSDLICASCLCFCLQWRKCGRLLVAWSSTGRHLRLSEQVLERDTPTKVTLVSNKTMSLWSKRKLVTHIARFPFFGDPKIGALRLQVSLTMAGSGSTDRTTTGASTRSSWHEKSTKVFFKGEETCSSPCVSFNGGFKIPQPVGLVAWVSASVGFSFGLVCGL